jgi:hypothetical protein
MIGLEDIARIEMVERDAWLDMYEAASPALRDKLGLAHEAINGGALMICRAIDHIQFNRLAHLDVTEPVREDAVDRALAGFDKAGLKNWIVHVAQGADRLAGICAARGLIPHPRSWAKFVRAATPAPAVTTSIAVREIGRDQASIFGATVAAGFGMPPFVGEWLAAVVGRANWRCFLGFDGDRPVAAGALYVAHGCGWLGAGATLASHRKRGAQSAMLAARINAAIKNSCFLLTTETGIPHEGEASPSFVNIQRAGFAIAYPRPNLKRP